MREVKNIFNRVITVDDVEQFDTRTNTMRKTTLADSILKDVAEGESIIDETNNRVLIKKDGKYFKQVISNNNITLEEV